MFKRASFRLRSAMYNSLGSEKWKIARMLPGEQISLHSDWDESHARKKFVVERERKRQREERRRMVEVSDMAETLWHLLRQPYIFSLGLALAHTFITPTFHLDFCSVSDCDSPD